MAEDQVRESNLYEITGLILQPLDRLLEKTKKLRQIIAHLESGEPVNPKRLKKLVGSVEYWADKLAGVGLKLVSQPEKVIGAHYEIKRCITSMKKENQSRAVAQGGTA